MSKFLLRLTPALALVEPVVQDGKFIGQRLIQHVAALEGIHAALEVVTSGEKVFEIWDLRKRLDTLKHPADVTQNAGYVVLSDYEKDALIKGVKAVDWTFRGTVNVWVRWPQFFDDLRNIVEFDEKNPPVDYLEDKKRFEAALEAHTAQIKALEEAKLAALKEGTDKILAAKLAELQAAGKSMQPRPKPRSCWTIRRRQCQPQGPRPRFLRLQMLLVRRKHLRPTFRRHPRRSILQTPPRRKFRGVTR
jgi:hypothetical protein